MESFGNVGQAGLVTEYTHRRRNQRFRADGIIAAIHAEEEHVPGRANVTE